MQTFQLITDVLGLVSAVTAIALYVRIRSDVNRRLPHADQFPFRGGHWSGLISLTLQGRAGRSLLEMHQDSFPQSTARALYKMSFALTMVCWISIVLLRAFR